MKTKRFYNIVKQPNNSLDIDIYGDIGGWYYENTIESLSEQIKNMTDVNEINVYINSYGGELSEGLAIYNALKQHKATVNTYVMGFACSSASLIFMSGDNRYISKSSMLMIHNAICSCYGNSEDMRAMAETLDKMNGAIRNVYADSINISMDDLKALLDKETFLNYEECVNYGFATDTFNSEDEEEKAFSNSALDRIINTLHEKFTSDLNTSKIVNVNNAEEEKEEEKEEETEEETETETEETETETETEEETEKEEEKEEEENKETKENVNKVDYIGNLLKIFQ